jgi:hypothetical protein
MANRSKGRVLSIRTADDVLERIEDFRRAQIAIPSQTEALRALVRLGFEKWAEGQLERRLQGGRAMDG